MNVIIYGLYDPFSYRCRYVGKTKHSSKIRLKGHISDARRRGSSIARFAWINKVLRAGKEPIIRDLEIVSDKEWQECERKWIRKMRELKEPILNGTDGGDGTHGYSHTKETRMRQSRSAVQRFRNPMERIKTGEAVRVAYSDPELRKRVNEKLKSAWTPGLRRRHSNLMKTIFANPEIRLRRSLAMKGRVITEEWRKKISRAKLGLRPSDETRKKMSLSQTGRVHSKETRQKISLAAKRRYEL